MPGKLLMASVASALVLTACGGEPGAPVVEVEGTTDPAGAWVLTDADPAIDVPAGSRVTLEVVADGDTWEAGGTSACNSYGGRVVIDGERWHGEGYAGTDMACEEPRMAAEQAYLDALMRIDTWARPSDDQLVLTGPDLQLRFEALPPVPLAALTDTTWVLEGLVEGAGPDATVTSTAAGAEEATLVLHAAGTVDASTGCRTFTGEWVETGDEILLSTFGQRDDSPNVAADGTTTCEQDVVRQEDHVLSVLGDGFRAEIDGEQLTLVSRDGLALTYRASKTG